MRRVVFAILVAVIASQPLAVAAQPATSPPQRVAAGDDNASWRLLTTTLGAVAAASAVAMMIDGWAVEMMMSDGLSAEMAEEIVSDLEGHGGFEAAGVAIAGILGGVAGSQLGTLLFPPPAQDATPVASAR
ncbi:MAG: hypothetical protein GC168_18710 [Candidatus Hydrogenedens sp.]|nr:hypothetical protein [Candidatus Hydrogenedens sp.]